VEWEGTTLPLRIPLAMEDDEVGEVRAGPALCPRRCAARSAVAEQSAVQASLTSLVNTFKEGTMTIFNALLCEKARASAGRPDSRSACCSWATACPPGAPPPAGRP
jgi:hypothetical protein